MALAGLHVSIGAARLVGPLHQYDSPPKGGREALRAELMLSETLAVPGTTAIVTPPYAYERGFLVASLRCSKDAWIAIGATPNAATNPRIFMAANSDRDLIVSAGDRIAWAEA